MTSAAKSRIAEILQGGTILAAPFLVYGGILRGDWVWDDRIEIADNPEVRGGLSALGKIWADPGTADYFPLKTSLQWLGWHLWGENRLGYHLVNVALQAVSALLVWFLLKRLFSLAPVPTAEGNSNRDGTAAWLGALLFAVHPLAVESVAWIAEFKNTLSEALLLGAFLAWLRYDRTQGLPNWMIAFLLFCASCLGKTSVVLFPGVLLAYAYWRRGRVERKDLAEAAPFALVSAVLGLVTWVFQEHRTAARVMGGQGGHLLEAGAAAFTYLAKAVLPLQASPIYPAQFWSASLPACVGLTLAWIGLVVLVWIRRGTWGRHALFGLVFFILNLIPVLEVIPMAYSQVAWGADHFAYLSLLAVVGLAAACLRLGLHRWPILALFAGAAVVAFGLEARARASLYRDNLTFWTAAEADNPNSWTVENNLGNALTEAGRIREAVPVLERALRLDSGDPEAHYNLAVALAALGRPAEAILHYERALSLRPNFARASNNLGSVLAQMGRQSEALARFQEAVHADPGFVPARNNLGLALTHAGRLEEGIAQYHEALRNDPHDAEVWGNLGNALAAAGRLPEAIDAFQEALNGNERSVMARVNLGNALLMTGRAKEAAAQYAQALGIDPSNGPARQNLDRLKALYPDQGVP